MLEGFISSAGFQVICCSNLAAWILAVRLPLFGGTLGLFGGIGGGTPLPRLYFLGAPLLLLLLPPTLLPAKSVLTPPAAELEELFVTEGVMHVALGEEDNVPEIAEWWLPAAELEPPSIEVTPDLPVYIGKKNYTKKEREISGQW